MNQLRLYQGELASFLNLSKMKIKSSDLAKLAATTAISYYAYKLVKMYIYNRKYRHIPGPKPSGILGFFFGNIPDIGRYLANDKIMADFIFDCHEKYGDVFKIYFFDRVFVCTTDRETIRNALITKNYPKSEEDFRVISFPLQNRFMGFGLVTDTNNERWKHRRAMFNPGFHKDVLMTFVDQFNLKADMLMSRLRPFAESNQIVELFKEFNHATLDAIAQIAFGMNIDSINHKDPELGIAISIVMKNLQHVYRDPLFKYKWSTRNDVKDLKYSIELIRRMGREKILERLKEFENNQYAQKDILSSILMSTKDDGIDLDLMIDDFATFFVAGQETTANSLAFCFLELGKNKDIFYKAREEIDRVIGDRTEISYQDAVDLKYCNCIFKEALRLNPPAPWITRLVPEDIQINGYQIPANTIIQLSTYVCGRLEKYFPNPLEFKPERFLKDPITNTSSVENYTYFPFSLGPRNCIGQKFAQIEAVILIAKLIQKFDISLDMTQSFKISQELTIRPKDGTKCYLKMRS